MCIETRYVALLDLLVLFFELHTFGLGEKNVSEVFTGMDWQSSVNFLEIDITKHQKEK